jgi:glutaredoxin
MMRLLLAVLALMLTATAAGQVYRWTDEKGRVIYGNDPPPSAKTRIVQDRINSYSGPPEVQRAPAATRSSAPAGAAMAVVMYSTDWCGYCKQARIYFAKRGIAYTELDVEKNPAAHAEFKRLGGRGVPFFVHGGNVMRGFSEASFEAFIARR